MRLKNISIALIILLISSMPLYGCTSKATTDLKSEMILKNQSILDLETKVKTNEETNKVMTNTLTTEKEVLQKKLDESVKQIKSSQSSILYEALTVINLLKIKDMTGLASHIHPTKGVRFSPFSMIKQSDLVFTSSQIVSLLQSTQSYTWGVNPGSGDPIQDTFSNYYNKFVYDQDFANPHMIGNNVLLSGGGNLSNNIVQFYPNLTFVEFHFTGFDPQYNGQDWKSLRLVFENVSGIWYLVGIAHDQWTI